MIVDHALARLESLPRTAPAHGLLPCEIEILVKGVVVPILGLGGYMTGLASCALVPQTVRGLMDEGTRRDTSRSPSARVRSRRSR